MLGPRWVYQSPQKFCSSPDLSLEGGGEGSMPCTSLEWGIYEASGFCR